MRDKVEIFRNKVVKTYVADHIAEYEKALGLHELLQTRGVRYPKPLSYDNNSVEYEKLENIHSIREVYLSYMTSGKNADETITLFQKAGEILGFIHTNFRLEEPVRWTPNENFSKAMLCVNTDEASIGEDNLPYAFLHCDYGFSNVFYNGSRSDVNLVVLDSSPNGFSTFNTALYGPVYIDICNMMTCIEGLIPVRLYPGIKWHRLAEIKRAFLEGYGRESTAPVSSDWINRFTYAIARCYFQKKYKSSLITFLAMKTLFNGFKGNNPTKIMRNQE